MVRFRRWFTVGVFYGRMFALIYTYASRTGVLLAPTLTFAYIVARGGGWNGEIYQRACSHILVSKGRFGLGSIKYLVYHEYFIGE